MSAVAAAAPAAVAPSRDPADAIPLDRIDVSHPDLWTHDSHWPLFARLRRKGLVKSVRGPGGGYRLAMTAHETRIADIVLAVDEPLRATRCGKVGGKGCMMGGERCMTHDLWEEMGRQLHSYLASVSLADVLAGKLRPDVSEAA